MFCMHTAVIAIKFEPLQNLHYVRYTKRFDNIIDRLRIDTVPSILKLDLNLYFIVMFIVV